MTEPAATASSATAKFNVLGPITVEHGRAYAALGGPRQVAVLARLLVGVGQIVSMDQLVEAVWDGAAPAQPEVTIRSYISNLRRSIEPARSRGRRNSCIESCSPGYRLAVEAAQVDAHRFERALDKGRGDLAAGELDGAVEALADALSLWHGGAYESVLETVAVAAARTRLDELRLVAIEALAEVRLLRGEHETVMSLLEPELVERPLRERLTELAMLALYRAGRQSEALATCGRLRTQLVDRLGIDPGPAIRDLEHKILTHDDSLRWPRPSAPSSAMIGLVAEPNDVVISDRSVVERLEEQAARRHITMALRQGRGATVAVTGEPGSGKSVLAASLVDSLTADLADQFPSQISKQVAGHEPQGAAVDRSRQSLLVAIGRCRSVAADQLMWPWAQVLADLVSPAERAAYSTAPGRGYGSAPGRAYGGAYGSAFAGADDPALLRMQVIVDRLRVAGADGPVLVVIEDVHWADVSSLETLVHAAEELAAEPVAFVVTWRNTEGAGPDVRQALRRLARIPAMSRIELAGLHPAAVERLVAAEHHDSVALANRLHQAAAGNPALIDELLVGLRNRGTPDLADHDLPLTTNLREMIRERVEHAHDQAFDVLTLAAIVGGPFSAELLAGAGDLSPTVVDDVLERAVACGLLSAAGHEQRDYRFVHPVAAHVLLDDVSGPRRARMYGTMAEVMWRRGWPARQVARQFARAGSASTSVLAARFGLEAAAASVDVDTLVESAGIIEQALSRLQDVATGSALDVEGCCFLAQWARIRGDGGGFESWSTRAITQAQGLGDPELMVSALMAATGPWFSGPAFGQIDWMGHRVEVPAAIRLLQETRAAVDPDVVPWLQARLDRLLQRELAPHDILRAESGSQPEALLCELALHAADQGGAAAMDPIIERLRTLGPQPGPVGLSSIEPRLDMLRHLAAGDRERAEHAVQRAVESPQVVAGTLQWIDVTSLSMALGAYLGAGTGSERRLHDVRASLDRFGLEAGPIIEALARGLEWQASATDPARGVEVWVDDERLLLDQESAVASPPIAPSPVAAWEVDPRLGTGELILLEGSDRNATPLMWAATALDAVSMTRHGAVDAKSLRDALDGLQSRRAALLVGPAGLLIFGPMSYYAACAALGLGEFDLARDLLEESHEHGLRVGAWSVLARTWTQRGRLAARKGDMAGRDRARLEASHAILNGTSPSLATSSSVLQPFPNEATTR